jgi:hypothetical protein
VRKDFAFLSKVFSRFPKIFEQQSMYDNQIGKFYIKIKKLLEVFCGICYTKTERLD